MQSEASDQHENVEGTLERPKLSFKSITFSGGQTIELKNDEIIIFVGPNNAGKSATLKELQNAIGKQGKQIVIQSSELEKSGDSVALKAYLEINAQRTGEFGNYSYAGIGYNIHHSHIPYFDSTDNRHTVAPFFSTRLATEVRITASNPAGSIALYKDPPSHAIHLLLMDDRLAGRISGYFRQAFAQDLIVFRAGGSTFPLYVGMKPHKELGEDELSRKFVQRLVSSSKPLEQQGDGMRSFATVILNVLAPQTFSIQFLDEPEAFLHPPQARLLGELIARERKSISQLFIATHSTDILQGLLKGVSGKVRIVRIRRDGDVNYIKELSNERTEAISKDTLTRYSGVFEGIFYPHVIITESDSDCLFYHSILNTNAVSGAENPDVLFIHASGKHRMGKLAETLRALDVPVSVIADIDIISEESVFRGLFEKLGGKWEDISTHWSAIKKAVETVRPPLVAEQVKTLIQNEIGDVGGTGSFPKDKERNIKNIFKSISPWSEIKQAGRSGIRGAPVINHFDQLTAKCCEYGLWIVPVGELEGFCRSIEAGHGPAFVEKVLEERELERDPELNEARNFVKKIWARAQPSLGKPSTPLDDM